MILDFMKHTKSDDASEISLPDSSHSQLKEKIKIKEREVWIEEHLLGIFPFWHAKKRVTQREEYKQIENDKDESEKEWEKKIVRDEKSNQDRTMEF